MSYGVSVALQTAVYAVLSSDAALAGLVGAAIYDQPPAGPAPGTYVSLGTESVRDASDKTTSGARHDFTVSVISDAAGFSTAKAAAGAVSDALVDAPLALARGRLIGLVFLGATARRTRAGQDRRIDLRFRAFVEDS